MASRHGKKYQEAVEKLQQALASNGAGGLNPMQACEVVRDTSTVRFDASIEAHVRLGVDPRQADQMVRGTVALPNGTGKSIRVLAFVGGDKGKEAQDAGADFVGGEDLVERIRGGWTDFDVAIATPDMMSKVGPLGKILGPRGLMPNPKVGTVSPDVAGAVRNAKAGQVRYRVDKAGIVHCTIGKASFEVNALKENLQALMADLQKSKPAAAKGIYLKRVTLSSTMGPGVAVDHSTL